MTTPTQNAKVATSEAPSASFTVTPQDDDLHIDLDTDLPHPHVSLQGGDIHIVWESAESPATLTFHLPADFDDTQLDGIQLGFLGEELPLDTSVTIPFQCRCDTARRTLTLTLQPPLWGLDPSSGPVYSFTLFGKHLPTSKSYRHDPKIYNQGGGGGGISETR